MSIHLHIERLVLEGLDARPGQGPAIRAAVERELARLLATQGLNATASRSEPHLPPADLQLTAQTNSSALGRQIGGALYQILNPSPQQIPTDTVPPA